MKSGVKDAHPEFTSISRLICPHGQPRQTKKLADACEH